MIIIYMSNFYYYFLISKIISKMILIDVVRVLERGQKVYNNFTNGGQQSVDFYIYI